MVRDTGCQLGTAFQSVHRLHRLPPVLTIPVLPLCAVFTDAASEGGALGALHSVVRGGIRTTVYFMEVIF